MVALSHYDDDKEKLDFRLSNRITNRQIEKIISAWQTGGSLPALDKEKITFEFVISRWNIEARALDPFLDNYISESQAKRRWISG